MGNVSGPSGPGGYSAPSPSGYVAPPGAPESGPGSQPIQNMQAPQQNGFMGMLSQLLRSQPQGQPRQGPPQTSEYYKNKDWLNMSIGGIPLLQRMKDVQKGKTMIAKTRGGKTVSRKPENAYNWVNELPSQYKSMPGGYNPMFSIVNQRTDPDRVYAALDEMKADNKALRQERKAYNAEHPKNPVPIRGERSSQADARIKAVRQEMRRLYGKRK